MFLILEAALFELVCKPLCKFCNNEVLIMETVASIIASATLLICLTTVLFTCSVCKRICGKKSESDGLICFMQMNKAAGFWLSLIFV